MNTQLFRILYCSNNCIAGNVVKSNEEIHNILTAARVNNRKQSVTGALLFNSGFFAQVLEGPQLSVERIFESIQQDTRHGNVTVLESGEVAVRDFPDWSMAYVRSPSENESVGMAAVLDQAMIHPEAGCHDVMDLLRTLVVQDA